MKFQSGIDSATNHPILSPTSFLCRKHGITLKCFQCAPKIQNNNRKARNLPKAFNIYCLIFVLVPKEVLETNRNNLEAFDLNTRTIWKFLMQRLGKFSNLQHLIQYPLDIHG